MLKFTSTEKKFFVFHFLSSLWFHLPIWILFFLSKGFTLVEVAFINMFFWASIVFFEIPTGYVADFFGRKTSIIISYFTQSIGIALFVIGTDSTTLIISSVVWGIGITMSSGAETAWLYDEIQYSEVIIHGRSEDQANDRYHSVYSSLGTVSYITMAISQILGGFLAEIQLYLPHTLVAIIFFFVAFYAILIPEHKEISQQEHATQEIVQRNKPSLTKSIKDLVNPVTFALASLIIVLGTFLDIRYFMQDDLSNLGLSYVDIGIFFAFIMIAISIGNSLSVYLTQRHFKSTSYAIFFLVISLGFILMSFSTLMVLLFVFLVINVSNGILNPLLSKNVNKFISTENRATVLSIISLVMKFLFIGFQIVVSYIILFDGFDYAYFLTGVIVASITFPSTLYLLKNSFKLEKTNKSITS